MITEQPAHEIIEKVVTIRFRILQHEQELKIYQTMYISGTIPSDVYFEQTGLIHESIENLLLETKKLLTQYSTIQNELGV